MISELIPPGGNNLLLLDVCDIRRGFDEVRPGWAMGSFYPDSDLRHSKDFEIKEWERATMQTDWRSHPDLGSEYISVLQGVLTVIIGHNAVDGKGIEQLKTIEVQSGKRIVLGAGVWRKFTGTDDVKGISIRKSPAVNRAEYLEQYRALTEHWKHTDQIRQWLLYNLLMASSIIVVAWSALYSTTSPYSSIPLIALSTLGGYASIFWLIIMRRATGYYDMYEGNAVRIECKMTELSQWPFHRRAQYRDENGGSGNLKFAHLAQLVPISFLIFYLAAMVLSVIRAQ